MAASKAPDSHDASVHAALARFLEQYAPQHLTLAYSGGMDSTVLLHALATLQPHYGFGLKAVHVHHGLSPQADAWARHCLVQAQQLGVACEVVKVRPEHQGKGLEAAARQLRYAVLEDKAEQWLLTAHHQRDQAETVLLNLLRGSGVAGLAGMRMARDLSDTLRLGRPLLTVPWRALQAYALRHQLNWVEDDTNAQLRFRRNWLRHRLLPFLLRQFPAVENKLAQVAEHMQAAQSLLDTLAQQDLAPIDQVTALETAPLLALPDARRHNALRYWFRQRHGLTLTRQHLYALDRLLNAAPDRCPEVRIGSAEAVRFQGRLIFPKQVVPSWRPTLWSQREHLPFRFEGALSGETRLIPFELTGLPLKPYKKAFQQAGIPPWQRLRWPVACQDGAPRHILGVGPIDKGYSWPEAAVVQVALEPHIR